MKTIPLPALIVCRAMACALVSWWLAASLKGAPEPTKLLTEAAQVRGLSLADASRGYRVSLAGVVTFAAPSRGLLFVQDATGGIFISPQSKGWDWRTAQKVEVVGVGAPGSHLPYVNQAVLRDLGPGVLPIPRSVTFERLAGDTEDGNWVEVRGVVRAAALREGRLFVEMVEQGKRLRAIISEGFTQADLTALVDAEVRLQGVSGMISQDSNRAGFLELLVPNFANLTVDMKAPEKPFLAPARPIASLRAVTSVLPLIHRVRVNGTMRIAADGAWNIADQTGAARVQSTQAFIGQNDSLVEVLGFPSTDSSTPILEDATVRFLNRSWPETAATLSDSPREYLPVLTEGEAIRQLPRGEAQRGYPVRIRGTITYSDPQWKMLFVQDETSGIYLSDFPFPINGKAGQAVEVEGFTGSGQFSPIIREPRLRVLGDDVLPGAMAVTLDQLMTGGDDGMRVEIRGTVQYLVVENGHLTVHVITSQGRLKAFIPGFATNLIPDHLVDAEVRVLGVCGSLFNKQRQLTGAQLFVPQLEDIRVTKPAPADPFAQPVQAINSLLQFQPQNSLRHRVHVRGTVTYRDPKWYTLFIEDQRAGLFVRTLREPKVTVGDEIDIVGFASLEVSGPVMSEAILRRIGPGTAPSPAAITIAQAISGDYGARLVSLEGRLIERVPGTAGHGLVLQGAEWTFLAYLEGTQSAQSLAGIRNGCTLKLTGICGEQFTERQVGTKLFLHLRWPSDVVVLKQPSRLTRRHWLTLLASLSVVLAASLSWVGLLRRNVHKQTILIRRKLEQETALEAQLSAIYDGTPMMMCLVNEQLLVERMNRSLRAFVGSSVSEAGTQPAGNVIGCVNAVEHPNGCGFDPHCDHCPLRSSLAQTFQTGQPCQQAEMKLVLRREGVWREFWVSVSTALVHMEHEVRVLVCLVDVTGRKQLEAQFLQAQKMEAIGQLAGGVAHDFNNILAAIIMQVGLLKEQPDLDQEMISGLSELEGYARRAANLTRQLLLLSRRQTIETKLLDFNELLAGLMKMLGRLLGEHIVMEVPRPAEALWVNADPGILEQIVMNLCVNARDAMPKGGNLRLTLDRVTVRPEDIRRQGEARAGRFVRLSVADTGCGMTEDTRQRIFEPFFTTKERGKGTGLGLATVYGIAKQHQGWVEVESAVGVGTIFRVYLPSAENPKEIESREKALAVRGGTETILLVEDDISLRRIAKVTLCRFGYQVLEARNGVDALRVWQEHQNRIALLLTDMVMPARITGLDLAEQFRVSKPSLKVVISSGYSMEATRDGAKVRFITKPYTPNELALVVRGCLDERTN